MDEQDEVWESTVRKDVMVGQRIGEYVVRRRIGSGGMGVVYEGEHPDIGRKVAIKIIRPDSSEGVRSRELVEEARAASAIRHRGIIDIFGFGTLPGIGQYLVMEFLNGRPLDEVILDRAPMLPAEALRLMVEVLGALSAAHAEGVIHRDLKPGNIFVVLESNGSEYVKVLDFGLAKRGAAPHGATPQTRASMIVGTPEYMAPEQACGQAVSPRTDLYAVGIILFEMLTGRLPFRGDSPMHVAIQQVQAQPPAPSSCVDGLPPALDELILRLLAKDPEQRPASAEEVARELKAISKELAVEMTQLSGFARVIPDSGAEPAVRMPNTLKEAVGDAPRPAARPRPMMTGAETFVPPRAPARPPARAPAAARPRPEPVLTQVAPTQAAPPVQVAPTHVAARTEILGKVDRRPGSQSKAKWLVGAGVVTLLGGVGLGMGLAWNATGALKPKEPLAVTPLVEPVPQVEQPRPQVAEVVPPEPQPAQPVQAAQPEEPEPETPKRSPKGSGKRSSSPARVAGEGTLKFATLCWFKVVVDDIPRGDMPMGALTLPAGEHQLELLGNIDIKNPRRNIFINPGKTTKVSVDCSPDA